MKKVWIALAAVAIVTVVSYIASYNSIVSKYRNTTAEWPQLESQLQQRNDLIPKLVKAVKGYILRERAVVEGVNNARSQWSKAADLNEKIKAASAMDAALGRLLLVTESYSSLRTNQAFLKLTDELSGIENKIAVERMRYNERARAYNATVRRFPGNLVAAAIKYQPVEEYSKAEDPAI